MTTSTQSTAPTRNRSRLRSVTYLAEAAARVVIVETTSTSTALVVSKVMPYAVAGVLALWTFCYGRHTRRQGERLAAEAVAEAVAEAAAAAPAPQAAPALAAS